MATAPSKWPDAVKPVMIRSVRKRLRLGQRDFGELMGVSANGVYEWESGRRVPRHINFDMFLKLAAQHGFKFDANGMIVTPIKKAA